MEILYTIIWTVVACFVLLSLLVKWCEKKTVKLDPNAPIGDGTSLIVDNKTYVHRYAPYPGYYYNDELGYFFQDRPLGRYWYVLGFDDKKEYISILHRLDGPAVECKDGEVAYWIHGVWYHYDKYENAVMGFKGIKKPAEEAKQQEIPNLGSFNPDWRYPKMSIDTNEPKRIPDNPILQYPDIDIKVKVKRPKPGYME
jgi:hypothetical protein